MADEQLLEAFRIEVCGRSSEVDPDEDQDWFSLSLGFFIAKGATPDKAHELALLARYTHQYWC